MDFIRAGKNKALQTHLTYNYLCKKLFQMKKFLIAIIFLAVSIFIVWKFVLKKDKKEPGQEPVSLTVSKHSEEFNLSMNNMMTAYYSLTESFVNWDTLSINTNSVSLKSTLELVKLDEMKKDSAIYPTVESQWGMLKSEIDGLIADIELNDKKESLNMFSQQLFDLLRIVKYDAAKVYYQECPMALNDYESSAFWLSTDAADDKRRNPYLGLHDPKYGTAMLICGNTKDSIRIE
jgi:hypothetical protein